MLKKILLINNYSQSTQTDRIERIEVIIRDHPVKVVAKTIHFTEFRTEMINDCIGIILSGSELNVSEFNNDEKLKAKFNSQLDLIRNNYKVPILAICFGFHLVAYAYGAQVSRMKIKGLGGRIISILIKKTDELITQRNIPVNAHHLDFVSPNDSDVQEKFEIRGVSRSFGYDIIQYMKHNDKPIYSVQFHPETHLANYTYRNQDNEEIIKEAKQYGEEIIINFANICNQ